MLTLRLRATNGKGDWHYTRLPLCTGLLALEEWAALGQEVDVEIIGVTR